MLQSMHPPVSARLTQVSRRQECEDAMLSAFTGADDTSLALLGAEHAAPGSVHVRPIFSLPNVGLTLVGPSSPRSFPLLRHTSPHPPHGILRHTSPHPPPQDPSSAESAYPGAPKRASWLVAKRGGLHRCLPHLVILGSQRSGLASIHSSFRCGWHLTTASGAIVSSAIVSSAIVSMPS